MNSVDMKDQSLKISLKRYLLLLGTALFCLLMPLSGLILGGQHEVQVDFSFDVNAIQDKQIAGYRLYMQGQEVCNTGPVDPQNITCVVTAEDGTYDFTLAARYGDDSLSPQSAAVPFTITTEAPPPPVASISPQNAAGVAPFTVQFDGNNCTGTINSYSWSFGDGASGSSQSISHTYHTPGTYTATLTVAGAGATSTDNVDIQVTAPPIEPTANITCFNCAGEAPITVQFDGSGSTSPQSTIESYHWDLGGGVGANEAVVSHTFTNPGTYNVMLTVTDSLGLTGTETMPIVVASPPEEENQPPVASFTFSTLSGEDPLALMFDGSGASDTDGTIEAYNWDFGDGNSSSSMSVNHTFAEVGEYQVTLQVTDNDGESTVSMQTVNVQAEEEIDLFIEISEMQIDDNWTPVSFSKPFNDPVVIVGPPSFSDSDPATVRVRNVTADGFEIRIQKWDYLENGHGNETVSFIAIEKGVYTLPRGTKIEVGSFEGSADYQSIALQQSYELTPVIFSQVMTESEADAVTGRIRNVSQGSYEYKLQEQESTSKSHQAEMVGYIAWEPGIGDLGNFQYEVGLTGKKVTHKGYTFTFQTNLSDVPLFLADMQTQTGGDTAVLRGLDISKRSARLKVEEEKSKDKEVRHSKENVGFLAIIGTTQPSQ